MNRGAALNKQLDWKLSLKACNQALLLDKDNVKGLYRRAVALAGLGQGAEAEGDLLRVLELAPQNKDAQRRLRELRKAMKKKPKPKPKKAPPSPAEAEDGFTPCLTTVHKSNCRGASDSPVGSRTGPDRRRGPRS